MINYTSTSHVCTYMYNEIDIVDPVLFVVQSKGQVSSRAAGGGMMGAGGMHPQIKQEMIDPTFEDLECKRREGERERQRGGDRERESSIST